MTVELTEYPKYPNSCDFCIFLGRHRGMDLYYHDDVEDRFGSPYLARYGPEGGDYLAGYALQIEDPEMHVIAKKLALGKIRFDPLRYEENPCTPILPLTVKAVRNWSGVEEVYELLGNTSEVRWLWVKTPWWLWPSSKDELQRSLDRHLPIHTRARVVRFTSDIPTDAVYAHDD